MLRNGTPQTRNFTFDLPTGRLMSATNPESGTVSYAYYPSGRLKSKTDPKGQKVVYSYDGYGRLAYIDRYPTGATLPDLCQSVILSWDSAAPGTNGLGRISSAQWGAYYLDTDFSNCGGGVQMTEFYGYSPGGLVSSKSWNRSWWGQGISGGYGVPERVNAGPVANFSYDNEGHNSGYSMMYASAPVNGRPSYNTFTNTLDAMGRSIGMAETDQNGQTSTWVQNVSYGPAGELKSMQYRTTGGAWYTENRTFNNRLQLTQLQAAGTGLTGVNLQYSYPGSGANSGQISGITDALSGEQIAYTYDALSRLTKGETTQSQSQYPNAPWWGQSFTYDGFGNLTGKTPTAGHTGTTMSLSIDPATNHVLNAGFGYDPNGNMIGFPTSSGTQSLTYDVANRSGGFWFDIENRPLDRGGVWNLYGLNGERLETVTLGWYQYQINSQNWVAYGYMSQLTANRYFAGRLIQSNGQTVVVDHLGSVRANEAGQKFEYYPYGEEITPVNPQNREKFATYTRESATGLDYADQRYFSSTYGVFTRPDSYRPSGVGNEPRTWNRYAYATGDPVNNTDPRGQEREPCLTIGASMAARGGIRGPQAQDTCGGCDPDDPSCGDDPCAAGFCGEPGPDPDPHPKPPKPPPPPSCSVWKGLAPDSVSAVQTVMGENSDYLIGHKSYLPDDTSGSPTGSVITSGTVAVEDVLMFSVFVNRTGTQGFPGTIGAVATQAGQFAGYAGGIIKYNAATASAPGSALCNDLTDVIQGMGYVFANGSQLPSPYLYWKAIDQGKGNFHVFKTGDIYIANTAFGISN